MSFVALQGLQVSWTSERDRDFSVFRLYPVLSSIFHSAPGPLLLHHCRQGDLPRRAVAAFGHMLFHCANEQSPRLLSTLGYAPLSFVAEDANFLRATGCYGGIYPLLQKRFSSAKVLTHQSLAAISGSATLRCASGRHPYRSKSNPTAIAHADFPCGVAAQPNDGDKPSWSTAPRREKYGLWHGVGRTNYDSWLLARLTTGEPRCSCRATTRMLLSPSLALGSCV